MHESDTLACLDDHLLILHVPATRYRKISLTSYAAVGTSQGSELLWP